MQMRRILYHSNRYILVILIFSLPFLRNISSLFSFKNNAYAYILQNFGGIYINSSMNFLYIILFFVPNVLLIYAFSDFMKEDCIINYVYVFTRMKKKQKWLFQKTVQLFIKVSIIYIMLFTESFVIAKVYGARFDSLSYPISKMLIDMFFFNVVSMFEIIFIQNFLSLSYGGTQSFIFVLMFYSVAFAISMLLYNKGIYSNLITALLLPSNQMYIWHDNVYQIIGAENLLDNPLKGYRVEYSIIILILYCILNYIIARFIFIKRDLVEMMKGV